MTGTLPFHVHSYRYPHLPYSSSEELLRLSEEVTEFQLMSNDDILANVWEDALVQTDEDGGECYYRHDVLWQHIYSEIQRWSCFVQEA